MESGVLSRLASRDIGFRLMLLALIVFGAGVVATFLGVIGFQTGLKTPAIALVACLVSALMAHVAGEYPRGDELIAARMALQMVVRSALPFMIVVWGIYFSEPPLEKSLVFYMILFYLIGLIAEVQLSLARLRAD